MSYKVFISYKNSDSNGNRTIESKLAENLYTMFMTRGIEVFYSNRSLLDFGEAAYKSAIEKALDEAEILIVMASTTENLTSSWVSYEWNSFHEDILAGDKKDGVIVPILDPAISRRERPMALRNYETFLLGIDPESKIIDFVEKILKQHHHNPAVETIKQNVKINSTYNAASYNEHERLRIQAEATRPADMPAIEYAMKRLNLPKYNVLDLGCAFGYVVKDRFDDIDNVKVIGVDHNENCIKYANENSDPEKYSFHKVNIEGADFEENLSRIMREQNISSFNIILSTLVLHHLKEPIKVLRKLRKFLSKDGYIIIRGSDDGSMVAYNDNDLVQKIIDKTLAIPGISDRLNGRKIYYQLYTSGYKHIRSFNYVKDIAHKNFDERQQIFQERFAYRRNYIVTRLKEDPTNMTLRDDLGWMDYALEQLEDLFGNDSFWYQEVDFTFIAKKDD